MYEEDEREADEDELADDEGGQLLKIANAVSKYVKSVHLFIALTFLLPKCAHEYKVLSVNSE